MGYGGSTWRSGMWLVWLRGWCGTVGAQAEPPSVDGDANMDANGHAGVDEVLWGWHSAYAHQQQAISGNDMARRRVIINGLDKNDCNYFFVLTVMLFAHTLPWQRPRSNQHINQHPLNSATYVQCFAAVNTHIHYALPRHRACGNGVRVAAAAPNRAHPSDLDLEQPDIAHAISLIRVVTFVRKSASIANEPPGNATLHAWLPQLLEDVMVLHQWMLQLMQPYNPYTEVERVLYGLDDVSLESLGCGAEQVTIAPPHDTPPREGTPLHALPLAQWPRQVKLWQTTQRFGDEVHAFLAHVLLHIPKHPCIRYCCRWSVPLSTWPPCTKHQSCAAPRSSASHWLW